MRVPVIFNLFLLATHFVLSEFVFSAVVKFSGKKLFSNEQALLLNV